MEVVFRPNENLCLLAALWGVANGEQKQLMTNGGETNVKDMFKHSMGKGKGEEAQLVCWGKKATGEMAVSACFVFDLFELKMDVKV